MRSVMQRRDFLKSAAVAPLAQAAPTAKPNFLFLIADDLYYRGVRSMGNPEVATPNIDRLISRGCAFSHCFHQGSWSGAVCVPSRTMLNSGLTTFHAHKRFEQTPLWGETLGAAGYDTFLIGKWHLSKTALDRSFKELGPVCMGGMFESGPAAYDRPKPGNTWTPWDTSLKGQWLHTKEWKHAAHDEIEHSASIWADGAIDFVRKDRANPFFAYVGFNSPHDPRQSPREFVERYPASRIEVPPNYLPEHPFDNGDLHGRDERLAPFPRTREAVQVHRAEYYAHITYLDAQVGRILDALAQSPKAANTYVILTADHGLSVGQHGLMGKQNLYDHSTRMPYVIAGPGIPQGRKVDAFMYQHSTFATTCDLAGIPIPKSVEFPSLAAIVKGGPDKTPHDVMFCWYRQFQRSVRTKEHKLIVYPEAKQTQLYDLRRDPWEITSLAGRREYAGTERALRDRLHKFQKDLDDEMGPV